MIPFLSVRREWILATIPSKFQPETSLIILMRQLWWSSSNKKFNQEVSHMSLTVKIIKKQATVLKYPLLILPPQIMLVQPHRLQLTEKHKSSIPSIQPIPIARTAWKSKAQILIQVKSTPQPCKLVEILTLYSPSTVAKQLSTLELFKAKEGLTDSLQLNFPQEETLLLPRTYR